MEPGGRAEASCFARGRELRAKVVAFGLEVADVILEGRHQEVDFAVPRFGSLAKAAHVRYIAWTRAHERTVAMGGSHSSPPGFAASGYGVGAGRKAGAGIATPAPRW